MVYTGLRPMVLEQLYLQLLVEHHLVEHHCHSFVDVSLGVILGCLGGLGGNTHQYPTQAT